MRVLHLGAGNIYGGIERALVAYAAGRSMCRDMIPEFAVCFSGQLEQELRIEGVQVAVVGASRLSRPSSVLEARHRLAKLLADRKPDVVVTHGPWVHCVLAPCVARRGIPLALFFHNPPAFRWLDVFARKTRPQLVITNSNFTLTESAWWIGDTPTTVCTYPFATPPTINREAARATLGINPNTVLILQAGRLDPYKGHDLHLRALSLLRGDVPWQALFVGAAQPRRKDYLRALLRLRGRLGLDSRVRFLGHRTDVFDILAAADIFCHPNTAPEPFGMVFVEAMLVGTPIVATKMGGAEEILRDGGGILTAPTPTEVARALDELLVDSRRRADLGQKARALAGSRYSVAAGVNELASALRRIAERSQERTWG